MSAGGVSESGQRLHQSQDTELLQQREVRSEGSVDAAEEMADEGGARRGEAGRCRQALDVAEIAGPDLVCEGDRSGWLLVVLRCRLPV